MMKVEIFQRNGYDIDTFKDIINDWLSENKVGPADIYKVTQTDQTDSEDRELVISVWYTPRPVEREWNQSMIVCLFTVVCSLC